MGQPILQVITDNDRRGAQVFAADLDQALRRLGEQIRTVALAPASGPQGLQFDVLGPRRRHPLTLRALRDAMRESSVVIAHGSTTLPMCAAASSGLSVPFVYRQISEHRFWVNTRGRHWRTRIALARASHVTALWKGAAEVLVEEFGVADDRVSIVPNGVPSSRCPPIDVDQKLAARTRFGLDPIAPTLLSLGALAPEKSVDVLVAAMREPALVGWQLLLVGTGPEQERLEELASKAPSGAVVIRGPVASGAEAIAAADVIGLVSRSEGMPAVLIEAGMMGVPAVATRVGGVADIVVEGRTGRLVARDDPAATARAVADVGSRRSEFGRAAREHCLSHFEIAAVASQWKAVLDRVRLMQ